MALAEAFTILFLCTLMSFSQSAIVTNQTIVEISGFSDVIESANPRRSLNNGSRIIGGTKADILNFPYQLSLRYNGSHYGGASIISSTFALTTAYCVERGTDQLSVRAGSNLLNGGIAYVRSARRILVHPRWNTTSNIFDYDVALIEVSKPFCWKSNVRPVRLPPYGYIVPSDDLATLSGWGQTESGQGSSELLYTRVPVLSNEECTRLWPARNNITDRMICAGRGIPAACYGDGGGSLVVNGVLVGISSFIIRNGCSGGYPEGYTRVAEQDILAWILASIGSL
ncbi:trypsin-1-like [Neocloeon triangulifer]|uniref:trypsin-1-like n=1 Tax=Neocloeon triangulifer TaxID=2078957 RepID=UPI00286ED02D|nr:trypsin-1-like [Neocloeon triangulifer]